MYGWMGGGLVGGEMGRGGATENTRRPRNLVTCCWCLESQSHVHAKVLIYGGWGAFITTVGPVQLPEQANTSDLHHEMRDLSYYC